MARVKSVEELKARMGAAVDHAADQLSEEFGGFDIQLAPIKWWRENWPDKKVQKLFIENFIRIRSKHNDNEIVPFKFNDVQSDYHFRRTRRNVVLKARQFGFSTYELALKFCKAILFSGRNIREVPHDPDAEEEFWSRLNVMYDHLPSRFRPATKYRSKEKFEFHDLAKGVSNSVITSLNPRPGLEGKLRSQTITDAHLTEIPFWAGDQESFFTALMAAAEKGDITLESTAGGKEKFHLYYEQGKRGKGGWTSFFYEWWWLRENRIKGFRFANFEDKWLLLSDEESILDFTDGETEDERIANRHRIDDAKVTTDEIEICEKILSHLKSLKYVDRDATWHCFEVAEYLAWRRLKIEELGGLDKKRGLKLFRVEHPENDIDCFDSSVRNVISPLYLKVTCEPQEPIPGREYLIGADTSLGTDDGDSSAIEVIDLQTGRQCHSEELKISPDLLAYRLQELSDDYNGAVVCVERNNTGIATIKKLLELVEPERVYKELTAALRRDVEDGKLSYDEAMEKVEFGVVTSTANKSLYAVFLEQAIRTGEIGLSNQEWCDQAQNVIWLNAQKTQWGAMSGFHDDRVLAMAIVNYVRMTGYGEFRGFVGVMPEGAPMR
ncbi:MAG: hypothetical protein JSS81_05890 [Acidobacteria bacterium]|nr:hypothetical protein [Acidobacteriota bacterium]